MFNKYIDGIHSYFDFVNLVENQTKKNSKENTGNNSNTLLSYEQFQKYFKIVIKFFLFAKGFEKVYYMRNIPKGGYLLYVSNNDSACRFAETDFSDLTYFSRMLELSGKL